MPSPVADWTDREFVFIGGLHRSGTTWLAQAVAAAHHAAGLDDSGVHMGEGQFLQDVYPLGKEFGGVTRWARDPRSHLTEGDVGAHPHAAARLWSAWSPYFGDARLLVEKTPLNLTKTRFLQEIFPRSRFVILTRHPITQALAVHKWSTTRPRRLGWRLEDLVEHWLIAHDTYRGDAPHLNHLLEISYEQLVREPRRSLETVSCFIGSDLNDPTPLDPARAHKYVDHWNRAIDGKLSGVRGAVEQRFLTRSRQVINRQFADRISRHGYDVDALDGAPKS